MVERMSGQKTTGSKSPMVLFLVEGGKEIAKL